MMRRNLEFADVFEVLDEVRDVVVVVGGPRAGLGGVSLLEGVGDALQLVDVVGAQLVHDAR